MDVRLTVRNAGTELAAKGVVMSLGRREFLISAGALAVSARSGLAAQAARPGGVLSPTIRADFPAASLETYMNAAAIHPLGTFAADAI
jgi:hypothetical protein